MAPESISDKPNGMGPVREGGLKVMSAGQMLEHIHEDILFETALIRYNYKMIVMVGVAVVLNFAGLWLYLWVTSP